MKRRNDKIGMSYRFIPKGTFQDNEDISQPLMGSKYHGHIADWQHTNGADGRGFWDSRYESKMRMEYET